MFVYMRPETTIDTTNGIKFMCINYTKRYQILMNKDHNHDPISF